MGVGRVSRVLRGAAGRAGCAGTGRAGADWWPGPVRAGRGSLLGRAPAVGERAGEALSVNKCPPQDRRSHPAR
ncbi:hypothetical protein STTU_4561 [Streptomyces sp. Tu6071]|nr:hypothetical protein CAC01_21450 [Streptomyces sp. CLI2509]EGJ77351.1 hypothetical protein STTU_4561 [Streptomyces sp. Tu6071]